MYIDILAILVGSIGGVGAVVFRRVIELSSGLFFSLPGSHSSPSWTVALLPILGGLIAGFVVFSFAPETRGHGVPQIMEALYLRGGQIRKRVGFILICVSAITIGSGGSAGREGPIAQIGASFGSLVGQIFKLGPRDMRILTVCGVAAGVAGTFNAPMGGALFGMEVVYRRLSPYDAVPILIAAVSGTAVAGEIAGPAPAFINPEFVFTTRDLAICFILGPVFGVLAYLWVRTFYFFEDRFDRLRIPNKLKPALGGVVAGVSGLYLMDYGIMGVGYDGINRVFDMASSGAASSGASSGEGQLFLLLMLLGSLKIIATSFSVGSGGSGGIFAPSLYIGAMFGVAFGLLAGEAGIAVDPPAYGLLGMGALFSGTARAPLTCMVMIPEMASNYSRLPPLIISCILSYTVSQILLNGSSIYTIKLMKRGIHLELPEPVLNRITIGDAMHRDVITMSPEMSISEVRKFMTESNHTGFPVIQDGKLSGVITFDDIRKVPVEKQDGTLVKDVASKNVITAYPEQSMKYAMDLMYENRIGRVPVVKRDDPLALIGIVTRTDAIQAYERDVHP